MNQYNKGSAFGAVLIIIFIISVLVGLFFFGIYFLEGLKAPYHGEHTGYVTAVERGGFIWQRDSVYIKTNVQSTQEDRYCVRDQALIPQLKEIQEKGLRATFTFDNPRWVSPKECSGATLSVITAVRISTTTNQ